MMREHQLLYSSVKLNTGDALRFVITHNERHIIQAKRNLNNAH